jgi:hypothetical protein
VDRLNDEEIIELWEERSAIIEYDGGRPRKEAERRACAQVKRLHRPNEKMPPITFQWREAERKS